jgi:predicted esterase
MTGRPRCRWKTAAPMFVAVMLAGCAALEPMPGPFFQSNAAAGAPVFIAQGSVDPIVRPEVTAAFIGGLCRRGEKVSVLDTTGVGHITAGVVSANAAVQWMTARFDGAPAPDDCAQRTGMR